MQPPFTLHGIPNPQLACSLTIGHWATGRRQKMEATGLIDRKWRYDEYVSPQQSWGCLVLAIGTKERNRLVIGGEEIKL